MALPTNVVLQGDCLERFRELPDRCVDLVFADPPFNIGYSYDVYKDRRASADYLTWCRQWIVEIRRVLSGRGSFWLAIGDEFAAELKLTAQNDAEFTCRSWIIWYYTFGVNCVRAFSRSHTHLFHFVCDPNDFTFNGENPAVRVASARQLVYADSRANSNGRLPDNTWIYRPQDAPPGGFAPMHDTWYFARVAGTFKEREGFHGCQMPEQLLGRILRVSSNPHDIVLDPFSGSGTTLTVAKKLGRRWLGFELSRDYSQRIEQRLERTRFGEPLDGPADPVRSAPKTVNGRRHGKVRNGRVLPHLPEETVDGVIAAYREACQGETTDLVLCRPELNTAFVQSCARKALAGNAYTWNCMLLRIRKSGKLPRATEPAKRPTFRDMDQYSFASEIAMQAFTLDYGLSLDDLLCNPAYASEFDRVAADFAPGFTPFEYRWAAMAIRKRAKQSRSLARTHFNMWRTRELPQGFPIERYECHAAAESGVYLLNAGRQVLYVGEAIDVRHRLQQIQESADDSPWRRLRVTSAIVLPAEQPRQHGLQSMLIGRTASFLNCELLRPDSDVAD